MEDLRKKIDHIDQEMQKLLEERLMIVGKIALYKKKHNLPIFHPHREKALLELRETQGNPLFSVYTNSFFSSLFTISRAYQEDYLANE